jgi:hypothetical protein
MGDNSFRWAMLLDERRIEATHDQGHLLVEVLLAGGFEMFLAAPCGPFCLCDCAVTGQVCCDRFEGDAAVAGAGTVGELFSEVAVVEINVGVGSSGTTALNAPGSR